MTAVALPAFRGVGIELEYMIVDAATLDVTPLAGDLLRDFAGQPASAFERGDFGWSNELVQHVVEVKNLHPSASLDGLAGQFQTEVRHAAAVLSRHGAKLLPGGMHPWMDPSRETKLWQLDNAPLYAAFDRIFDCRRHGWANLQSMHVNLPFSNEDEFSRLHAAIRTALPLIPALAASSPYADGAPTAWLDYRLETYRANAARCPAISGEVIPEPVRSRADYDSTILAPMYRQIAPLDPEGMLRHEWLNGRGAIARFERNAIEIRLADAQECPRADLAVAHAVTGLVRALYEERWCSFRAQCEAPGALLVEVLRDCVRDAERASIDSACYLGLLGYPRNPASAQEVWSHVIARLAPAGPAASDAAAVLELIQERGPLARRILHATANASGRAALAPVYERLAECLASGTLFTGET